MHKYRFSKGLIYESINEIVDHKTLLLCTSVSISNLLGKSFGKINYDNYYSTIQPDLEITQITKV